MAKLIVGLGNPGMQYEQTRHNAGFIAIDVLLQNYKIIKIKNDFNAILYFTDIQGEKVIFAKPQTYMNLSGEAVLNILNFYKISTNDLIVLYDDKDTPLSFLRFREQGSSGGHNGIKSIIKLLGTQQFNRVRIGINPPLEGYKISDWVLSKMSEIEIDKIKASIEKVSDFLNQFILENDFKKIMSKFNK